MVRRVDKNKTDVAIKPTGRRAPVNTIDPNKYNVINK